MARLPQPGGDDGSWGDILNDFLLQAHNADGSLKQLDQSQVVGLIASLAAKLNAADAAPVATSGDYRDLTNVPTLPAGAIVGNTDAQTLTNKRVTKRVQPLTDAATVTPNCDNYDGGALQSLSQPTTIANLVGLPTQFQTYVLRIKSSSTQGLSWGGKYRGSATLALPTATTGGGKTDYFGFQWHSDDGKWDLLALNMGF